MRTTNIDVADAARSLERTLCAAELAKLMTSDAGVVAATVSTVDGLEVACVSLDTRAHAGRLAAITSSLQALGVAVTQELELATLEGVTIEAKFGRVFSVGIEMGRRSLILAVVTSKRSLYARTMLETRDCAARIAAALAAISHHADRAPTLK